MRRAAPSRPQGGPVGAVRGRADANRRGLPCQVRELRAERRAGDASEAQVTPPRRARLRGEKSALSAAPQAIPRRARRGSIESTDARGP